MTLICSVNIRAGTIRVSTGSICTAAPFQYTVSTTAPASAASNVSPVSG